MYVSCCAKYCYNHSNVQGTDVTFHRFPLNNKNLLQIWIDKVGHKNWQPDENSRLCSKHFTSNSFIHMIGGEGNYRILHEHAVPSTFKLKVLPEVSHNNGNLSSLISRKNVETTSLENVDSSVCPHHISFIEEKAKCYKLQKELEGLKEELGVLKNHQSNLEIESLKQEIKRLKQKLFQNLDSDIIHIDDDEFEFQPVGIIF